MKIALFDFEHFQYVITFSQIFEKHEIYYYITPDIYEMICDFYYFDKLPDNYIKIEKKEFNDEVKAITAKLNKENFDLLILNPIFYSFKSFHYLAKSFSNKIIFTTHNLNFWFKPNYHSPRSLYEKWLRKRILYHSDYIAVEEFLFNYIKKNSSKTYDKHHFIHIPYTLYFDNQFKKIKENQNTLKVVLPGSIDNIRRNYEDTLWCINKLFEKDINITFSFAGRPSGKYGMNIIEDLKKIDKIYPNKLVYFDRQPKASEYRYEMESADVVLSTSNKTFNCYGTQEFIGKTKPTGILHNMISFQVPGILPALLPIPNEFNGSALCYKDKNDLYEILVRLTDAKVLKEVSIIALNNSQKFTPEIIRKKFPFKI